MEVEPKSLATQMGRVFEEYRLIPNIRFSLDWKHGETNYYFIQIFAGNVEGSICTSLGWMMVPWSAESM